MKIEHIAIWVEDLEKMKAFYLKFFDLKNNEKYINPHKKFSSYFLSFSSGARIELMHKPELPKNTDIFKEILGLAHIAISVGSREKVDSITKIKKENGYTVLREFRVTGDGYCESVNGQVKDDTKTYNKL